MRERQLVAPEAILRHEQPAGQPLLDLAAAVGKRRRRGLQQEGVCVAQHGAMQGHALIDAVAQARGPDALSFAGSLNESVVRCPFAAKHDRQASHALAADDADLDARFVVFTGNHGGKTGFDEIDLIDAFLARLELLSDREIDGSEVGLEQPEVIGREAGENTVGVVVRRPARLLPFPGKSTSVVSQPSAPIRVADDAVLLLPMEQSPRTLAESTISYLVRNNVW